MQGPRAEFELPPPSKPPVAAPWATPPEPVEPPLSRLPWVWAVFILFFIPFIFSSLTINDSKSSIGKDDLKVTERMVESQLGIRAAMPSMSEIDKKKPFEKEVKDLATQAKIDLRAQKLRIVLSTEDKTPLFPDDLRRLTKSKNPENAAFAKLYSTPPPTKDEALKLLEKLDKNELSEKLADVQVRERFGDKAIRKQTFGAAKVAGLMLITTGMGVGCLLGVGLWLLYYSKRSAGAWKPKGLPLDKIDMGRADRLIFLSLAIFGAFLGSQYFFAKAIPKVAAVMPDFMLFAPIFIVMFVAMRVPIFGWRLTWDMVGVSRKDLGQNLKLALGALVANVPIITIMLIISSILQKILPGGGHPATEEIMNHPSVLKVFSIFILASIVAPIWEEFFFRGLLFPAFKAATGRPVIAAILSSFVFASIHPQGLAGILPLMSIALMFCAVSYQSKSLVANMIMHGIHNALTLGIGLILAWIV